MPSDKRQPSTHALNLLRTGTIEVIGRLWNSSNITLLVDVTSGESTMKAVYKPEEFEPDLWDFPPQIWKREVAAFELSAALQWNIVPETVARTEGPHGPGSLQRFVDADFEQHYLTLREDSSHTDEMRRIATFDIVANNTDRKSGHVILGDDGNLWAIDNGLCFNSESKLRTVIWDHQGESIPANLIADLVDLRANSPAGVEEWLSEDDYQAFLQRIDELIDDPRFPTLQTQRQLPWPLV